MSAKINKVLSKIDDFADSSKYLHQVEQKYIEIRDTYSKEQKDDKNAQKIQWIIDVLNFRIEDNEIKEMMSGTTEKGEPWKYPDISRFTDEAYKIIETELKKTKSIKLKAHYADFLWLTKKDHKKAEESKEHFGLDVLNSFRRAFIVARQINYKKEETKNKLERLVFDFNAGSSSKNKLTIDLVEVAISHKKEFLNDFFKKLLLICAERANILLKDKNFFFARSFLQNAHKIENNILKTPTKKWQEKIAESFVTEAGDINNKGNIGGLLALTKAITAFQQLGNTKKVEEIKKNYKTLSKNVQFKKINHEMNVKPLVDHAKKQAEKIVKLKPEEILAYLTMNEGIYPKYSQVKERGEELSKKFISRKLFGRISFDQNMNLANHSDSENEEFFSYYNVDLEIHTISINTLFEKIIVEGKLNWKEVKKFFKKYSWFGKEYETQLDEGKPFKTEKWINLLEPGLKLYFSAAKKLYKSKRKKYPFSEIMLATESLSLKIEGLIREFFQKLSIPTSISEQIKGGKTILRERDLNSFLRDDKAKEVFGEDLVALMRAVLIEESVYNLRNNTAHCFFMREHFHFIHLHLLFIIILIIENYTLKKKEQKK